MTTINAYINFNGNCKEAMTFYKECLGGELTLQTVEDSPMANQWPPEAQKKILHAMLHKDALVLLGSDVGSQDPVKGNTISLSLTCSSDEEINTFFSSLSSGAEFIHPLEDFFAGKIGTITDKFGINWMFYYDKNGKG